MYPVHSPCSIYSQLTLLSPPGPPSLLTWTRTVASLWSPGSALDSHGLFSLQGPGGSLKKNKSEISLSCLNPSGDSHRSEYRVEPLPVAYGAWAPACLSKPTSHPSLWCLLCSSHIGFLAAFWRLSRYKPTVLNAPPPAVCSLSQVSAQTSPVRGLVRPPDPKSLSPWSSYHIILCLFTCLQSVSSGSSHLAVISSTEDSASSLINADE